MKKIVLLSLSVLFVFSSCAKRIDDSYQDKKEDSLRKIAGQVQAEIEDKENEKKAAFEEYVSKVSLHDKVCQLFIENIEGDTVYLPVEKEFIPGGYIFFSFNLKDSAKGIMAFTDSIRNYCVKKNKIPPYLAIDQEGGLVNRLKIVNGPLPSAERVSSKVDLSVAYKLYSLQALQMKALGFDMNIAPVIEIKTAENEQFLNGRSFGDFLRVRSYGTVCVNAYENHGIGTVIKHFPGNTNTDPHTGLPEILLSEEELKASLRSFRVISNAYPAAVLMSHARVKAVDGDKPACFSKKWVSETLREDMGFEGIIFSDDIFMGALALNGFPPEEAAVKALEAGVNVIMISEKRFSSSAKVLISKAEGDPYFMNLVDRSFRKVMEYKLLHHIVSFKKNERGQYELLPCVKQDSLSARLSVFEKARRENIDLYIDYFE